MPRPYRGHNTDPIINHHNPPYMRRTLIILAVTLIVLIGGLGLWGLTIPAEHRAASQITIPSPPESVYAVIRDIDRLPTWWKKVSAVEPVLSNDGWERWRETSDGMQMTILVRQEDPNAGLVTTIDTIGHPPFGGTWTYALTLAPGGGTAVKITEDGRVANPYFRVMLRLGGTYATLDSYLTALGKKFGKDITPAHVVP